MFQGVPGLFRAVPGCSGGVPGVFRGVQGVFRGVPGYSGFYRHPQYFRTASPVKSKLDGYENKKCPVSASPVTKRLLAFASSNEGTSRLT